MRLQRVKLVNFRQHAESEVLLGPGITAIIGPNGAGKTTLLEAIAWAFYGAPAARGTRDSLRWNRAPARSQVRVEVDFALGAHEYRVVRGLYNAELYQDRFDAPVARTPQEVTARVERLLGMSRSEFFSTYFTGQKELAVMAAMGPADRARFLSRILGYERLREVQDRVRGVRATLRGELEGLQRGLPDAEDLAAEAGRAEERVGEAARAVERAEAERVQAVRAAERERPQWEGMMALRERALALEGDRRVAVRDVEEARRAFERLDRELGEARSARSRLEGLREDWGRLEPLEAELEQLERESRAADRRRWLTGQLREVSEQGERTSERLRRIGDLEEQVAAARRRLEEARAAREAAEREVARVRTVWVQDRQDAETKRLALRDQYREVREHRQRIVEAGPEGTCPTCARPLGREFETVVATLERQLEEIEVQGKFFTQRCEQLAGEPPEVRDATAGVGAAVREVEAAVQEVARLEDRRRERRESERERDRLGRRRDELEREIAELPDRYDAGRHDALRAERRELEPTVQLAAQLRVKAERAERLVAEAEAAERELSAREARVAEVEEAVAGLGFSEDAYAAARGRYEAAEAAVRKAEIGVVEGRGDLRAAEEALEGVRRRMREREERAARVAELAAELRVHDELDRALGDLRGELNAAMRPELAERASAFLAELTDGRYVEMELDERYEILVLEEGVAKPVISGGEEDVANLVLRLAISQMVAERAGQPLSLLVLDEIFGSLDEHRRHNVVGLLRRLADRFPQVILITHIEAIRDGVDRVIRVTLDERRGAALVTDDQGGGSDEDVAA